MLCIRAEPVGNAFRPVVRTTRGEPRPPEHEGHQTTRFLLQTTLKNLASLPIISGGKPVILRAGRFERKGRKPTVPFKEER